MEGNTVAVAREISCPGCGRRYPWKEQYVGRQVTCKCGVAFRVEGAEAVPAVQAAAPAKPQAPRVGSAGPGTRGVAVGAGYMVGHRARPMVEGEGENNVVRDWVAPVALLGIGVVGRAMELGLLRGEGSEIGVVGATILAIGGIVIGMVALGVGVIGTAQIMGSEMEPIGTMARKFAGLAAFAAAAAVLGASFDKDPMGMRGPIVALHGVLLVYFVGLCWLLKMDLLEGLVATVFALGVQIALYMAVGAALPKDVARLMFYGG